MSVKINYILFLLLVFTGCKKYTEGGRLGGFSGTDQRISGNYEIVSFTVNGNDSLTALKTEFCSDLKIEFKLNAGQTNVINPSCGTVPSNYWKATDDRLQIEITTTLTTGAKAISALAENVSQTLKWDIQRLKKDDLWISIRHNNNEYYLKLKK
jgi:hypothetical protein